MAFDEKLAARIETIFDGNRGITKKEMFGGLCFLHFGNMLCGVDNKSQLMVRAGAEQYEKALAMKHASKMDFTGRPLKGMVYVAPEGIKTKRDLTKWLNMGLRFTETLPKKG